MKRKEKWQTCQNTLIYNQRLEGINSQRDIQRKLEKCLEYKYKLQNELGQIHKRQPGQYCSNNRGRNNNTVYNNDTGHRKTFICSE